MKPKLAFAMLAVWLAALAQAEPAKQGGPTLYQRLGEQPGINLLVSGTGGSLLSETAETVAEVARRVQAVSATMAAS